MKLTRLIFNYVFFAKFAFLIRYFERILNQNYLFKSIEIEINSDCNFNCKYCPNFKYKHKKHCLDTKYYYKIIKELKENNYKDTLSVHFYNEPLLDSRLVDLLCYTKKKLPNVKINLFTNGSLLTKELFNLLLLIPINLIVITQHTKKPLHNLIKLFKSLNYNQRKFIIYKNLNLKNSILDPRLGIHESNKFPSFNKCTMPSDHFVINCDGDVVLCCNDYKASLVFGNIKKSSIMEIWASKKYRLLRKDLLKGRKKYDICKNCSSNNPHKLVEYNPNYYYNRGSKIDFLN